MPPFAKWLKINRSHPSLFFLAIFLLAVISYLAIHHLRLVNTSAGRVLEPVAVTLFSLLLPISLSWMAYRRIGAAFFLMAAIVVTALSAWAAHYTPFFLFVPTQVLFCIFLYHFDHQRSSEVISRQVGAEELENEKNDLELAFKEKGTSISVFFDKYTSYYNLRNLAVEFSRTLSLKELSQAIVSKTIELIQHAEWCLLFLSEQEGGPLSLFASKSSQEGFKVKAKGGDVFDQWIVRNRQSLIVMDKEKEFRFDVRKTSAVSNVRSIIGSPLIQGGKVIGTLRMTSDRPGRFTTDDLRLLDAISTLASSAVSNAVLFQKTEELAIRDSVTNLYVRRYFLERLAEEHRRSLLTNASLTLVMCDLDHFKACNDRYGHAVGDYALSKASDIFRDKATAGIVARYGGEEFAILLPSMSLADGRRIAQSLREAIEQAEFTIRRERIPMTVSLGVASIPADTLDPEELIQKADERLYQAKKQGRNRVC